jgi:hypothetical protein
VFDPALAVREGRRVSKPGARALWTANNRWAPLPEPHLHLWGLQWLPRGWQAGYVRLRRDDLHPYSICMRSRGEMRLWLKEAGYVDGRVEPAPLYAPQWGEGIAARVLAAYNGVRLWPGVRHLLLGIAPRFWVEGRRD